MAANRLFRILHLSVGTAGLVVFILTGQYMHRVHAHLRGMPDGPRMIYRSAHIYILFAALLNLLLGAYLQLVPDRMIRTVQQVASVAVLALPAMFLAAFFTEPQLQELVRPWARPAIYLSLGAVGVHVLAKLASDTAPLETPNE